MCQVLVETPKPLENEEVPPETLYFSFSSEFGLAVLWVPDSLDRAGCFGVLSLLFNRLNFCMLLFAFECPYNTQKQDPLENGKRLTKPRYAKRVKRLCWKFSLSSQEVRILVFNFAGIWYFCFWRIS